MKVEDGNGSDLGEDVTSLRRRIEELEAELSAAKSSAAEAEARGRAAGEEKITSLLSAIPDLVLRVSRSGVVLHVKRPKDEDGFAWLPAGDLEGRRVEDVLPAWAESQPEHLARVLGGEAPLTTSYSLTIGTEERYQQCQIGVSGDDELLIIVRDRTERQRAFDEQQMLQEVLIEAQAAALAEISTPLLPIHDGVVVMPIIGAIDASRADQVMETLLEGVVAHGARIAILDITGVAFVDIEVANTLVRAAHAVKLLGTSVILTGMRPEVARTIVELGADLGSIVTRGTLQSGIHHAMTQAGRSKASAATPKR